MKKLLIALILIIAAAFGGSHFMWNKAVTKAETALDKALTEKVAQMPDLNVTYDVEASGYPLAVTLTYSNIRSEYREPKTGEMLTAVFNSPVIASASLFSPSAVKVTSDNTEISIEFPESFMEKMGEEDMPIQFNLGWDSLAGTYDMNNIRSGETEIKNLKLVAGAEAMPMTITVANLLSRQDIQENGGLSSGNAYLKLDDMEIRLAVVSVPISVYEADVTFDQFPTVKELETLSRKFQTRPKEELTEEEFEEIMGALRKAVDSMISNASSFNINTMRVESESLQFNLEGGVKVTPDALVDGEFSVNIAGVQKFIDMLPEDHPSKQMAGMAVMMGDGENIELSATFKDGMVVFNGAPVLPIPPINTLLDHIQFPSKEEKGEAQPDVIMVPDMNDDTNMDMPPLETVPMSEGTIPKTGAELEATLIDSTPMEAPVEMTIEEIEKVEEAVMEIDEAEEAVMEAEDKPTYPTTEAEMAVTEEDLQKMLMEIDETLKESKHQ